MQELTKKQEDDVLEEAREASADLHRKENICSDCGELWNSEFHIGKECVNLNE